MTTVSRRIILLLAAVATLLVLLPACYTLFEHPQISALRYARPSDSCLQCHSRNQLWEFPHTQGTVATGDAWGEYYDEPWWYHRYLRGDSATSKESIPSGDTDS